MSLPVRSTELDFRLRRTRPFRPSRLQGIQTMANKNTCGSGLPPFTGKPHRCHEVVLYKEG